MSVKPSSSKRAFKSCCISFDFRFLFCPVTLFQSSPEKFADTPEDSWKIPEDSLNTPEDSPNTPEGSSPDQYSLVKNSLDQDSLVKNSLDQDSKNILDITIL